MSDPPRWDGALLRGPVHGPLPVLLLVMATVLTMTLTGIAADVRAAGRPVVTRRVLAGVTMFVGALAGALLVLHGGLAVALLPAPVLLAVVVLVLAVAVRRPAPWQ